MDTFHPFEDIISSAFHGVEGTKHIKDTGEEVIKAAQLIDNQRTGIAVYIKLGESLVFVPMAVEDKRDCAIKSSATIQSSNHPFRPPHLALTGIASNYVCNTYIGGILFEAWFIKLIIENVQ